MLPPGSRGRVPVVLVRLAALARTVEHQPSDRHLGREHGVDQEHHVAVIDGIDAEVDGSHQDLVERARLVGKLDRARRLPRLPDQLLRLRHRLCVAEPPRQECLAAGGDLARAALELTGWQDAAGHVDARQLGKRGDALLLAEVVEVDLRHPLAAVVGKLDPPVRWRSLE